MTKREFKYAMQRGLGRCLIELKNTKDIEKYRDIVMWGCRHELAYDPQCEGTRALYLYELISFFPDNKPFLQEICKRLDSCYRSNTWEFARGVELLSYFSMYGDKYSHQLLLETYKMLLDVLKKQRRTSNQLYFMRDNFDALCVAMVTHQETIAECEEIYNIISRDIKDLVNGNKVCSDLRFYWFEAECRDIFGKETVPVSEEKVVSRKDDFPQSADEVYDILLHGDCVAWRGSRIPLLLARKYLYNNKQEEVVKLAKYYDNEQNEKIRIQLLKLLARKECAQWLNVDILISDALSENEELSQKAFDALAEIKSEKVREFALGLADNEKYTPDVVSMLANNYQKKDYELIVKLVHKIPISYDDGIWHGVFFSIREMFHDKTIANPPKELLHYMYENTLCACCREYTLKEMGRRRMLTRELIEECVHDSSDEIREYANKKYKKIVLK